jgi:hypothetical protein
MISRASSAIQQWLYAFPSGVVVVAVPFIATIRLGAIEDRIRGKTAFPVLSIVLKANFRPGFFYFQVESGQYRTFISRISK